MEWELWPLPFPTLREQEWVLFSSLFCVYLLVSARALARETSVWPRGAPLNLCFLPCSKFDSLFTLDLCFPVWSPGHAFNLLPLGLARLLEAGGYCWTPSSRPGG